MTTPPPTPPSLGIVGGGQLARMLVEAATPLALDLTILAEPFETSARRVWPRMIDGAADAAGIAALARAVDVITVEHELVDLDALRRANLAGVPTHPSAEALAFTDKATQRLAFEHAGLAVPPFEVIELDDGDSSRLGDIDRFGEIHGWPLVAKVAHGGYDGRGVDICPDMAACRQAFERWQGRAVIEPLLPLDAEYAVVVARSADGDTVAYPPVRTHQRDGICVRVDHPSRLSPERSADARRVATDVANLIGGVGIVAVELFDVAGTFLINEIALRPHNTGHWTIEACPTSQFENHLRAIAGLPLGPCEPAAAATMVNVLGAADGSEPARYLAAALAPPREPRNEHAGHVAVHLYGKEPRAGRKLGHVTAFDPTSVASVEQLAATAERAAAALAGDPAR